MKNKLKKAKIDEIMNEKQKNSLIYLISILGYLAEKFCIFLITKCLRK